MKKAFWHKTNNFGDAIAPIILNHFTGDDIEFADRETKGKIISIGSVIYAVREGDTVWGTGLIEDKQITLPQAEFLAVRGHLTKDRCGLDVNVFGDPGLLLPLIYFPNVEKKYKIGIIPHYTDKKFVEENIEKREDTLVIDIQGDWKKVIEDILSCEMIVSSSLHGVIVPEAYGISVMWAVWTDNLIGGQFKFQDYFSGTGRGKQKPFAPIDPIENIKAIQIGLIEALKSLCKNY